VLCREEASDLCAALAAAADPVSLPVFAVVKETEAAEPVEADKLLGLEEFENKYFCGPLYHDEERVFWEALGNQPIFTLGGLGKALLNPLKVRRDLKAMGERMKAKGLEGNMMGDGLAKGGIMVIAPDGEIKFTYYEDPGKGVPLEEAARILAAARAVEQEQQAAQMAS